MQCTLMRADGPWSCEINLHFAYDADGTAMTPPLSVAFKTVHHPKDVEIWLRRAQAAILCPAANPSEFHKKTAEELKRMQTLPFSPNTIELLVRDPDGSDLCFVDLPGELLQLRKVALDDDLTPDQGSYSITPRTRLWCLS
jgi:vacuolar protein sorting-associated protein 1